MTYIYSRALAAAYSAAFSTDTLSSVPLNLIPTADLYLSNDKMTDTSRLSRYGMTFGHLTVEYGEALLTWYQEASRARTSVPPETVPESLEKSPASGLRCSESFGKFDRHTFSWRTPLNLFGEGLTLSSADWKQSGMMRNGECWERPMLAHRTTENDAGFWLTPTVVQMSHSEKAWQTRKKTRETAGRTTLPPGSLEEQVLMSEVAPCRDWNCRPANPRNRKPFIPTPRAQDSLNRTNPSQYRRAGLALAAWAYMYPTPTTNGMRGGSKTHRRLQLLANCGAITQEERRGMAAGNGGKLNPEWTEWLMGFPIGWSGLEVLATPKSPSVLPLPGKNCTNESMPESNETA